MWTPKPWPQISSDYVRDFGLALLIFSAAFVARLALDYVLPGRLPYITYFPAVVVAAHWCGLIPTIFVVLAGAFAGAAAMGPSEGINLRVGQGVGTLLFVTFCAMLVYLVHGLTEARARAESQEAQLELINRELKHRIKNLFTIASSICQQTIRSGKSPEAMIKAVTGRIYAVASAQDLLSVTSSEGADLNQLVEALVRTVAPEPSRLRVDGTYFQLPPQTTTPFALILHELGTNALKYGAWSSDDGYIDVAWKVEQGTLIFEWRERDGPAIAPPPREGLGSALIKGGLPSSTVQHDLTPEGLHCRISLPP